jgi:acetoacetyl-CoA synthetase
VVLVDGSPYGNGDDHLFRLVEEESISVLGVSAKYLAECGKRGIRPAKERDLSHLRTILSTGSPLLPATFDWIYDEVKTDLCVSSISGGTDIVSCFALGNPIGPVHRGELQTRGLAMAVDVYGPAGSPLVGEPGELVCTRPFPSMPVGFWDDPTGERYRAAYFEKFPGVWGHGDWVELTERGTMVFHGRSDATLNPGGVRIGTAEIYRQIETLGEIRESVVVGQDWDGDVRVVLFVVLKEGRELDGALRKRIRDAIRRGASPHHVPRKVVQVDDIPRTVSGKISEMAVRNVLHGRAVDNREALANPESLEYFRGRAELTD